MGEKVTFNPLTRIIEIDEAPDGNGEVFIDVAADLYSDGKEDWVTTESLRRLIFPIRAVGGDPLPGEKELGSTFFIRSDWKIRPYNTSHRLIIDGNFYSEDGEDPFLDTLGTHTVRIMQQVSPLVSATIQQLPEIEHASFNGYVSVDTSSEFTGFEANDAPVGTPRQPVNNLADMLLIGDARGFNTGNIILSMVVDNFGNYSGWTFIGQSKTKTTLTIDADAVVTNCEFYDATIEGTLDGNAKLQECRLLILNYIHGIVESCLLGPGKTTLGGGAEAHFLDCWSGDAINDLPEIDCGGTGQSLAMRNYNGGVKITNLTGTDPVTIDLNSGHVEIADSVGDNANITIRGVGTYDNQSNCVVDDCGLTNCESISTAVWTASHADYDTPGTLGWVLAKALRSISHGNARQEGNQWIIDDPDNPGTPLVTFNTFDKDGIPADVMVYKREKV